MTFNFIEVCRQFIQIDSSPRNGTAELVEYISKLCQDLGLYVDIQKETHEGMAQANIIIRLNKNNTENSTEPKEFLLQTHLDTIEPGSYSAWQETGANPFNSTIIQNKIYGLGSVDSKLDFVCKLNAFLRLKEDLIKNDGIKNEGIKNFKLTPVLAGTFGQELGMLGVTKLLRKKKISPSKVLVGDPSNLTLCCGSKGIAMVEIRIPFSEEEINYRRDHNTLESTSSRSKLFSGRAAHSSDPGKGENAIDKMFSYLEKMPESLVIIEMDGGVNFQTIAASAFLDVDVVAEFQNNIAGRLLNVYRHLNKLKKDFDLFPDPRFSPKTTTLNIGTIRTYEDHILICGVCRLTPSVSHEVYEGWMNSVSDVCKKAGGTFRIKQYEKPFSAPSTTDFAKLCLEEMSLLDIKPEISYRASCSEASVFQKMNIDCLSFGPGVEPGNSHSSSEHIELNDLNKASDFYYHILRKLCAPRSV